MIKNVFFLQKTFFYAINFTVKYIMKNYSKGSIMIAHKKPKR